MKPFKHWKGVFVYLFIYLFWRATGLYTKTLARIVYRDISRFTCVFPILFPELRSPWPAVGKRELWEQPLGKNKGNNRIPVIRLTVHLHLWRVPEMVAPRALVFRPLVKGNEALGTRLAYSWSISWHFVERFSCRYKQPALCKYLGKVL